MATEYLFTITMVRIEELSDIYVTQPCEMIPKLRIDLPINVHDLDVYTGEWLDNKKHGFGTYKYVNGDIYEGILISI